MKSKRTPELTYICNNTKIKGELTFEGNVRLDNYLEGNITSDSGLLIIGEHALIKGDIKAEAVVIIGAVDGSIEALDCVELAASGKVTGNICAPRVNFEPGSVFVGRCTIGSKPNALVKGLLETTVVTDEEGMAGAFAASAQSAAENSSAETLKE